MTLPPLSHTSRHTLLLQLDYNAYLTSKLDPPEIPHWVQYFLEGLEAHCLANELDNKEVESILDDVRQRITCRLSTGTW